DKAIVEMAEALFPMTQNVILTKANNPRAASPQSIAEQTKKLRQGAASADNLAEALPKALDAAVRITPADGLIVVCGSLYLAGELLKLTRH
ncbi:MAG: bifunctional folylpolyglutamate synthase/dihydrofolate synthase, partial [Blastocatellia bacterium]